MSEPNKGTCRSCHADVLWVRMKKTGRAMPLDLPPEKRIAVRKDGTAAMIDTYVSHFSTCEFADEHRKRSDGS